MTHRSGFACFVGRPNTGKSTLTNALVGQKVAIATDRPQTTRHAIRGIVHRLDAQLVLVDTPGLHKPRTLLGERLNDIVRGTLAEVDVIGLCIPANELVGPGDRFIAQQLKNIAGRTPVIAIVTKSDLVTDRQQMAAQLMAVNDLGEWAEVVPVSAVTEDQTELLRDLFIARLPEGPPLYVDGELTDEPELMMVAELIRESAIEGVFDELPHSINVVIEEMAPRPGKDLIDISAVLYLERDSQKGIVIGTGGERLREVGT
ncbi:MAG: GTPase, partial [Actinomycetota bacterium]|nr:GTPase [Actinomycetota bacterium]